MFTDEEQLRKSNKMWPTKGHYLYKSASAQRTPNISGIQAKQLGSKSLSSEHSYIKMLQINSERTPTAFTILQVKMFTSISLICLYVYVYLYTGKICV